MRGLRKLQNDSGFGRDARDACVWLIRDARRNLSAGVQAQSGPRLDFPAGLATDGRAVYVANSRNNTIEAIDPASKSLRIVAGTLFQQGSNDGVGPAARFNSPDGMTINGQNLYLCDTNNSDIRQITVSGTVTTVAGTANIVGHRRRHRLGRALQPADADRDRRHLALRGRQRQQLDSAHHARRLQGQDDRGTVGHVGQDRGRRRQVAVQPARAESRSTRKRSTSRIPATT